MNSCRILAPALLMSVIFFSCPRIWAQNFSAQGLAAGWLTWNADRDIKPQIGLRYIPNFSLIKVFEGGRTVDAEFSLNLYGTADVHAFEDFRTRGDIKPYRAWIRYSSSQFEARLGLQKINFGSAVLLRPLMWFDQIDPRDPLQLTDGVTGLLLRFYFLNNANIWLWGLYGNDNIKGWETLAGDKAVPEIGARFQYPLGNGEAAVTYHHREIKAQGLMQSVLPVRGHRRIPENRYALDGKWDIGIGIWFEGALTHQQNSGLPFPWQQAVTLGLDYTFGWGNGLTAIFEYFSMSFGREAFNSSESLLFSALTLSYPLELLDALSGVFYYDWKNHETYSFLRWQRTYDRWSFHLMGFWNPERFQIYQFRDSGNLFSGKGIQLMAVFNY